MSRLYICFFLFILEDGEERQFMEEVSFAMTLKMSYHEKAELESSQDSRFNCQFTGHIKNKGHSLNDMVDNEMFLV